MKNSVMKIKGIRPTHIFSQEGTPETVLYWNVKTGNYAAVRNGDFENTHWTAASYPEKELNSCNWFGKKLNFSLENK